MNYTLKYSEAGGQERTSSYVCPGSSGILQRQKTRLDPTGLTLIAYIPHSQRNPFRAASDSLVSTGHHFHVFEQLHFTYLVCSMSN
jgi:hypothetical protein